MPFIANYEVYVLEPTGWVLHARFASSDKAKALDEARAVDAHLGRPAKVIRESYDPESNRADDQTVFLSGRAVEARRRGETRAARGGGGAASDYGPILDRGGHRPNVRIPEGLEAFASGPAGSGGGSRRGSVPTHAKSTSDLVARVTFVIVASLVIATVATALIPVVINMLRGFGVVMGGAALSSTLFAAFMVVFLTSGFFLTMRLVPLHGVADSGRKKQRDRRRSTDAAGSGPPAPIPVPPSDDGPGAGKVRSETSAQDGGPATSPADQPASSQVATPEGVPGNAAAAAQQGDAGKDDGSAKEAEKKAQKEKSQKLGEAAERDSDKKKKQKEKDKEAENDSSDALESPPPDSDGSAEEPVSPAYQAGRDSVMDFLGGYVTALKTIRPRLDTYNRFGINLYLAGVCEVLAQNVGLTREEFQRLLREAVEIMGTRPAQAASFVRGLQGYLEENRYSQMVQSGREAMSRAAAGSGDPFASLGMVVEDWNTPKTQKLTGSTIAIVFTDMVGSTDLTSEHGDQIAQDILRAHNSAVRSALGRFAGKEIKHTGDGIMATFDHVPDAVAGMIDVLRAVRAHNEAEPKIPLRIRIGINAGEPISAENDYYGLAVTIAARVCAKADMDQILVSQVVRDMCEGSDLTFADRGSEPLKGIKEPLRLHEALWEGSPESGKSPDGEDDADTASTDAGPRAQEQAKADSQDGPSPAGGPQPRPAPGGANKRHPEPFDPDADGWIEASPESDGDGGPGHAGSGPRA